MNIAATAGARHTMTGQARQLHPGYMLCEDTRESRQPHRSRFTVRPWDANHGRLLMMGIKVITTGEPGPFLSPEPLLRKAANETKDKTLKAALLEEADQCEENRQAKDAERKRIKPTPAQMSEARDARLAQTITEGFAPVVEKLADVVADKQGSK